MSAFDKIENSRRKSPGPFLSSIYVDAVIQQQELIIVITVSMLGSFVLVWTDLISASAGNPIALALFKFLAHMPGKKVPRIEY